MVNHEMLSCEAVWREISNYLDGDVDAPVRTAMDEHFRTCKKCASVLAGTRNVVQLYGDERMLEVPAGFSRRLEKRLANQSAPSRGWSWTAWLVPVMAIVLVAVGLGFRNSFIYRNPPKSILAAPGHDIPPEMMVVVSDGSKVFHVAGCPFIHDKATERTITAKQAMQDGYVPCSRCMRQYLKTGLTEQPDDDDANAELQDDRQEVLSSTGH